MPDPGTAARWLTGLLPVLAFLGGLVLIDSYKLVRPGAVARSLAVGGAVAGVCFLVNVGLLDLFEPGRTAFTRYVSPLVEEGLKALYIALIIRTHRVGFLVDAAIHGFAVGAGFAFVENIYFLRALPDADLLTWIVRGFGTAVMHGGTMALMGVVSKSLADRTEKASVLAFLPGFALAYGLHALFNHFILPPVASTLVLLVAFPPLIAAVFYQSERATQAWLGAGFDTDQELLALLGSNALPDSRIGRYLFALRDRFPGAVVADMLCLLQVHVELSIRAKGVLMMQEAGFRVPPDPEVEAKLAELSFLEKSVGTTGLLALGPFLHTGSRDLWQRNLLARA